MKQTLLLSVLLGTFVFGFTQGAPIAPHDRQTSEVRTAVPDSTLIDSLYAGKRQLHTAAVSSISRKQLEQVAVTSVDQALKGRAAGVQVTQNTGAPGEQVSVRIRGISTIFGSNEPLYVIDGVPYNNQALRQQRMFIERTPLNNITEVPQNPLSFINPDDIASIEILKDAAAAAIYGSRASNGVVLITTRRGRTGSAVTLDTYAGLQLAPEKTALLDIQQYARLANTVQEATGNPPLYPEELFPYMREGTDWQEYIFRPAPIQKHQLTYTGGSQQHQFFASADYFNQQGIIVSSGFDRYSFRLNYDGQVTKRLKVGISSSYSNSSIDPVLSEGREGVVGAALLAPPLLPVKDMSGQYITQIPDMTFGGYTNPLAVANEVKTTKENQLLLGNIFGTYQLLKGLQLTALFGMEESKWHGSHSTGFHPEPSSNGFFLSASGSGKDITTSAQATLSYHKNWNNGHEINVTGGYAGQETKQREQGSYKMTFGTNSNATRHMELSSALLLASLFGQAQYSFSDKYFFAASVRQDKSGQYSEKNRTHIYPAVSAAWDVLKKDAEQQFLQMVKVRTSYGLTGNNSFPSTTGIYVNPDLKPETTSQFNVGADVAFFSGRILVSADYYQRITSDLFLVSHLPDHLGGYADAVFNGGSMENKGFELAVNSINLQGPFTWTSNMNFATNRNSITSLPDNLSTVEVSDMYRLSVNTPATSFYGYKANGIFQPGDTAPYSGIEPGDIYVQDLNGNGLDPGDKTTIGNAQPKFIYSLDNNFTYMGFELNLFLQGVQGNNIFNATRMGLDNFDGTRNASKRVLDYWSEINPGSGIVRLQGNAVNRIPSSYYIEDGSFLRLRNFMLAYNLPQKFELYKKSVHLKLYVSGQNLITFTNYTGYDPEVGGTGPIEQGYDAGRYPVARTFIAGFKISL